MIAPIPPPDSADAAALAEHLDRHLAELFRAPKLVLGTPLTEKVMLYVHGIRAALVLGGRWEDLDHQDFSRRAEECGLTPRANHLWLGVEAAEGRRETLRRLESLFRPLFRDGFARVNRTPPA